MKKNADPLKLVINVVDPAGRTRLFVARLPEPLVAGQAVSSDWPPLARTPTLYLDGEARPDIPLRDRFAVSGENPNAQPDR
jgi:hypothetical protein